MAFKEIVSITLAFIIKKVIKITMEIIIPMAS